MVGEDFGIAVVEGMAAGLIPVLHMSGGPWDDIVLRGKYGNGYRDAVEAVRGIEAGLRAPDSLRALVRERAKEFGKAEFLRAASRAIESAMRSG